MNNLKLFHVNVSQEWSAEAEAYVLATSKDEAEAIVEYNIIEMSLQPKLRNIDNFPP